MLLEYQGMLMSEPLAATLLSGAVLALFWARDPAVAEPQPPWRWLLPGLLLGALALVRPEYLAVGVLLAVLVLASGPRRTTFVTQRVTNVVGLGAATGAGGGDWGRRRSSLRGWRWSWCRGRCATR